MNTAPPVCTRCKRRPANYYRRASGEKLCTACLEASLLRAYRYHMRTRLGGVIREARKVLIVTDSCTPATSLALLHLSKLHIPRMHHILSSATVSILAIGGACSEIIKTAEETCNTLRSVGLECIASERTTLTPKQSGHPLQLGATRLKAVLEAVREVEPKPLIVLLPYAAEHLTQWYMGGLNWGLFWLPRLLYGLRESRVYVATPLAEHSMLDYAAYVYLLGLVGANCRPCKLLDTRLLYLQSKSPEYVFAALKLIDELGDLLAA